MKKFIKKAVKITLSGNNKTVYYVLPDKALISNNRQLIKLARQAGFNLPIGNTRSEVISDTDINLMYNDITLCNINIDNNYNNKGKENYAD